MTISEAFERFIFDEIKLRGGAEKTAQNYLSALRSFVRSSGDVPIELISYDTVIRWKMYLSDTGKQPSSIKSSLTALRQVLRYQRKHGSNVIDYRDIELPKVIRKEAVYLEVAELREIINCTTNLRDKALISAVFDCGGRISEVLSLNRDSIHDNKAQVYGKGSKLITLRFSDSVMEYINEYLDSRKDHLPPLFISGQYRRITVSRVEQILHCLAAEAGIEKNVTPHTLRHSFATDLLMNGADLTEVKEQLHHSSITTTQIYTHYSKGRNEETYKKRHSVL